MAAGIPKFEIPNLCGASAEWDAFSKSLYDLKKSLLAGLDVDASGLFGDLDAAFTEITGLLKGLVPEMPSFPDINFQAELSSLFSIDTNTLGGLSLFNLKFDQLGLQFGQALGDLGLSLSGLLGDLSAGFDVCDAAPNLVIGADGKVKEKAQNVNTPKKAQEKETPAEFTTAATAVAKATSIIKADFKKAKTELAKAIVEVGTGIPQGAVVTVKQEEDARKVEAQVKQKIGNPHPQAARVSNETSQVAAMRTVDSTSGKETLSENVSSQAVELTPDQQRRHELSRRYRVASGAFQAVFADYGAKLAAAQKPYPDNIHADGKRIYYTRGFVHNSSAGESIGPKNKFLTNSKSDEPMNYENFTRHFGTMGSNHMKISANVIKVSRSLSKLTEYMPTAEGYYTKMIGFMTKRIELYEEHFTKDIPAAGQPGGPKIEKTETEPVQSISDLENDPQTIQI